MLICTYVLSVLLNSKTVPFGGGIFFCASNFTGDWDEGGYAVHATRDDPCAPRKRRDGGFERCCRSDGRSVSPKKKSFATTGLENFLESYSCSSS